MRQQTVNGGMRPVKGAPNRMQRLSRFPPAPHLSPLRHRKLHVFPLRHRHHLGGKIYIRWCCIDLLNAPGLSDKCVAEPVSCRLDYVLRSGLVMEDLMTRDIIRTPNAPSSTTYSQAVWAAGLVFVSGTGPQNTETGKIIGDTIQEQTSKEVLAEYICHTRSRRKLARTSRECHGDSSRGSRLRRDE